MKNALLTFAILLSAMISAAAQDAPDVQSVVQSAYIDGIQNNGSIEAIRKGFHPSFTMLRLMNNSISPLPIDEWITAIEKRKAENTAPRPLVTGKFISVDITGVAASVKLELYREGKHIFTDYLSLYRFNEGWRIVSKTYHRIE